MVYESDFYTTRRPYRVTPSVSSYTVSKREIPWEKVPFVPRPSLVPDPVTAFAKRNPKSGPSKPAKLIIEPLPRASIRPKILVQPPRPYVSPRDATRSRVFDLLRREDLIPKELPRSDAMDIVLPKLHKTNIPRPTYTRRTPRHYVVTDYPERPRRAEEQYSYSYSANTESSRRSGDPYTRPTTSSYTTSESVQRRAGTGPGSNYSYSTERSSRTGDGPGSYHSSYSSTTAGRLPGGTTYRHYSYRV